MSADAAPVLAPTRRAAPAWLVVGGGVVALALVAAWHLTQGDAGLGLPDVWATVRGTASPQVDGIVTGSRGPRALAGVIVGVSLATAGVLFQTGTRNPLAESATLGVNGGAWLAVVTAEVLGLQLVGFVRGGTALVGGLIAAALVLALTAVAGATPARMVLNGTAVHLATVALAGLLLLRDEQRASGLFFWGQGTLVQANADKGLQMLPVVVVVAAIAVLLGPRLDLLRLDDDSARALGLHPTAERLGAIGVGVLLSAVAVAVAGPLAFVGLVTPHLVRRTGIVRHRMLVPAAAVWAAVLVLAADGAVQAVRSRALFSELPAGVAIALVGAPFLLVLARRIPATGLGGHVAAVGRSRRVDRSRRRPGGALALATGSLLMAMAAGLAWGEVSLPLGDVLAAVTGGGEQLGRDLVLQDRLPRVLVAALAGAALAVAGTVVQAVGRNPLAEPHLLGISGGASVAALGLLVLVPAAPVSLVPVAAFLGALLALGAVLAVTWTGGLPPERLLLVGVAMAAFTSALVSLLVVLSGPQIAQALVWITGSTYARDMGDVTALVGWPLVLVPALWLLSRPLDLLALGDEAPRALGLPLDRMRVGLLVAAVLLAAAAVANVGAIGFIGLIAPHWARGVTGNRHRWLIPLSAALGALLLVLADLVGRTVDAPRSIPSGLVVALLGAPAFLVLLASRRHRPG